MLNFPIPVRHLPVINYLQGSRTFKEEQNIQEMCACRVRAHVPGKVVRPRHNETPGLVNTGAPGGASGTH